MCYDVLVRRPLYVCAGLRLHPHRIDLAGNLHAPGHPNAGSSCRSLAAGKQIELERGTHSGWLGVHCLSVLLRAVRR